MDTKDEITPGGIWQITEIEVAARDIVDLGIWEAAEEEERAYTDITLTVIPVLLSVDTNAQASEAEGLPLV